MTTDGEGLRRSFDRVAELYDDARPGYPTELFDDLFVLAGLGPESRLLEIGCGTGHATRPLAARGCSILALEPGEALAAIARRNLSAFPEAAVRTTSFEAWEPGDATFDLVYAATAWHWLDADTRYSKSAQVLRPGGRLAFWGAFHGFPADADPFFSEIQDVYAAIGEEHPDDVWPPLLPDAVADEAAQIEASDRFEVVAVRRYLWEREYTAEQYLALLDTFSSHILMEPDKRTVLYTAIRERVGARADPRVRRHWLAILHVARRI